MRCQKPNLVLPQTNLNMATWEGQRENAIQKKSMTFGIRIVRLARLLNNQRDFILANQVLRSGTAIGALVRESQYAESRKDFIHKLSIAIKEANETIYWLELLEGADLLPHKAFKSIHHDNVELIRILTSIIKTSKTSKTTSTPSN